MKTYTVFRILFKNKMSYLKIGYIMTIITDSLFGGGKDAK